MEARRSPRSSRTWGDRTGRGWRWIVVVGPFGAGGPGVAPAGPSDGGSGEGGHGVGPGADPRDAVGATAGDPLEGRGPPRTVSKLPGLPAWTEMRCGDDRSCGGGAGGRRDLGDVASGQVAPLWCLGTATAFGRPACRRRRVADDLARVRRLRAPPGDALTGVNSSATVRGRCVHPCRRAGRPGAGRRWRWCRPHRGTSVAGR